MTPAEWSAILIALISAGLLKYAVDFAKWLRHRRVANSPEGQQVSSIATVDASLAVVARARDELEADNERIRRQLTEQDARYATELARRDAREAALQEEIIRLESKVREILSELEGLKRRHSSGPISDGRGFRAPSV